MIVVVDLNGTIVGNARLSFEECIAVLATIRARGHRILVWTSDLDVPQRVREVTHGMRLKPGSPIDFDDEWKECIIVDDEPLLLNVCRRLGARAVEATRLDEVPALLDDIAVGEA